MNAKADTPAPVTPRTARDRLFDEVDRRFGRNVARFVDARLDAIAGLEKSSTSFEREAAAPAATEGHYDGPREYGWHPPAATEALRVLDNLLRHHNTIHHGECEFAREARAALASPEPTPDSGPSKESRLRLSELRDLGVEAGWSDKFYAALAALWQVVKGTEIPAMGTPPHIVMADLIEDIAWPTPDSGLDVERLRQAMILAGWPADGSTATSSIIAAEYARLSSADSPEEGA